MLINKGLSELVCSAISPTKHIFTIYRNLRNLTNESFSLKNKSREKLHCESFELKEYRERDHSNKRIFDVKFRIFTYSELSMQPRCQYISMEYGRGMATNIETRE